MKRVGEQLETVMALDDGMVSQFLLQNPDFFIRNANQVEQMRVPHVNRGSVSLLEWQMTRQRLRIDQLEEEITRLMELAAANEKLFNQLLTLQTDLATAESLRDMLDRMRHWARNLGLSDVHLRLFTDKWLIGAPSTFTHLGLSRSAFEPVRIQRLGQDNHYLGKLNGPELLQLMPHATQVGSVAMSLLGEQGDLGVVIFTSRDSQHFQSGMGTVLLQQLVTLLPGLLVRWVARL